MAESTQMNIALETGADFILPFTIEDNNGNPVDLTGAVITSHVRRYATDAEYFEFTCIHNGVGGRVTITMPKETTGQMAFTHGVYDVKVALPDGYTEYVLQGDVEVRHGVTKPYDGAAMFMVFFARYSDLPAVGQANRIYFCKENGLFYRWNGSNYVFVGSYNGIVSIAQIGASGTSTTGITRTYRMTFSDGGHFDYSIKDGEKGAKGDKGDIANTDTILRQLGTLAFKDSVDYKTEVTNKPRFKALAFEDQVDYQSDQLINKPEAASVTADRLRTLFPDMPIPILMAIYLADETLYLDSIGSYDAEEEAISLPTTQISGVLFEYIAATETLRITVTGSYLLEDAPQDGNFYARRNGVWVTISSGGSLSAVSYDPDNEALVFTEISDDEE